MYFVSNTFDHLEWYHVKWGGLKFSLSFPIHNFLLCAFYFASFYFGIIPNIQRYYKSNWQNWRVPQYQDSPVENSLSLYFIFPLCLYVHIIFSCKDIPHFYLLITDSWVISAFWLLWIMLLLWTFIISSCLDLHFICLIYPWSRIAGSYGNSVFNLLRNCQAVF